MFFLIHTVVSLNCLKLDTDQTCVHGLVIVGLSKDDIPVIIMMMCSLADIILCFAVYISDKSTYVVVSRTWCGQQW